MDQHSCAREIPDTNIRQLDEVSNRRSRCWSHRDESASQNGVEQRNAALTVASLSCRVFVPTRADGTGVKWQMWGVIISMRRNAAVQHRRELYSSRALKRLSGARMMAPSRPGRLEHDCQKIFQSQLQGFLFAVSLTRLWGSALVHMWREGKGRYLRTITDCLCAVKILMMRIFLWQKLLRCHWTENIGISE